jgi:hypothetical protein
LATDQSNQTTTQQTEATKTEATTQSTDGKTILDDAAPKTGEAKKDEPSKSGAPEKYEDYKVPEGMTLDPEVKAKADVIFKELGLPQEGAQKLVDMYRELTTEAFQAPFKAYQEMKDGWLKEAQDHPDLRGKLGEGKEVNVRIGKFLTSLPDQTLASDFKKAMNLTGVGNHQAFIRVIDYAAQRLTEGSHAAGNGPGPGGQSQPGRSSQPTAAQAMWPTLPSAGGAR